MYCGQSSFHVNKWELRETLVAILFKMYHNTQSSLNKKPKLFTKKREKDDRNNNRYFSNG